jgi:hypothetical protein
MFAFADGNTFFSKTVRVVTTRFESRILLNCVCVCVCLVHSNLKYESARYVITNEGIVAFLEDRKIATLFHVVGNCCSDKFR